MPNDGAREEINSFLSEVVGPLKLRVEENLGNGYVRLHISEAEKRQAKHDIQWVEDIIIELLRNSRDAGAKTVFLATKKDIYGMRQIIIIDDGEGVPFDLHDKIFEPRVTSKLNTLTVDNYGVHGRGMALYSITTNTDEFSLSWSEESKGSAFHCLIDTNRLKERKDQSTFPSIKVDEGRRRVVSGPHNIIRVSTEFALNYPKIKLYVGSPSEIASTMWNMSSDSESPGTPWSGIAVNNCNEFIDIVKNKFNMIISERNAYRILQGDLPPLQPVIIKRNKLRPVIAVRKQDKSIHLGFNKDELNEISIRIEEALRPFYKKYSLNMIERPCANINDNQLSIKVWFSREDDD